MGAHPTTSCAGGQTVDCPKGNELPRASGKRLHREAHDFRGIRGDRGRHHPCDGGLSQPAGRPTMTKNAIASKTAAATSDVAIDCRPLGLLGRSASVVAVFLAMAVLGTGCMTAEPECAEGDEGCGQSQQDLDDDDDDND